MKRWMRTGIILFLFMCLTASAAAVPCVPVPPKDVAGNIAFLHPGASVAVSHFEQNGCDWGGFDQLNGSDGIILDVTGQAGPATLTATTGDMSTVFVVVQGHFLDESCQPIDGADVHATSTLPTSPLPQLITVPEGAKWLAIDSTSANAGNDMDVAVHSEGKDCPKKKKKKKR